MYLIFDTSILIDLERENKKTIHLISEIKKSYLIPPKITFITYCEFLHGIRKRSPGNKAQAEAYLELFEMIPTTKKTAKTLSQLKNKYTLDLADLLIASQVLESNAILVTKDKDFEQITEIEKIFV